MTGMTDDQTRAELADRVAEIWTEVLQTTDLDTASNFFEVGGESLRAIRITALVRGMTDTEVPLTLIFDWPVLGDYVDALEPFMT